VVRSTSSRQIAGLPVDFQKTFEGTVDVGQG
jgi:hypothetical protein